MNKATLYISNEIINNPPSNEIMNGNRNNGNSNWISDSDNDNKTRIILPNNNINGK